MIHRGMWFHTMVHVICVSIKGVYPGWAIAHIKYIGVASCLSVMRGNTQQTTSVGGM